MLLLIATGCGKKVETATDKIVELYETIMQANDTSVIRSELAELKNMSADNSLTEEERMYAQYTYNVAYGVIKLGLSGKSISVFDFPEMEMLGTTVGAISSGELEIEEIMVTESENFVDRVEQFLK